MTNFFVERKPRMFNIHMVHAVYCELLPADTASMEPLTARDMDEALKLAGLKFKRVRACSTCNAVHRAGTVKVHLVG